MITMTTVGYGALPLPLPLALPLPLPLPLPLALPPHQVIQAMHGLKLYGKKLDVQREFLAGQACIYHAYTMHIPCIYHAY